MVTVNPFADMPSHDVAEPHVTYELDSRLERAGVFRVYKEVTGCYLQPRIGTKDRGARIDRVLVPTQKLLDAGWSHGAVGIECKKPGKKLGPALAQCMDYSRAAFTLRTTKPDERDRKPMIDVLCRWVLLWPMDPTDIVGDIGSLMDQHRIGGAIASRFHTLQFKTSSCNLLTVSKDGDITIGKAMQGSKVGTR